MSVTFGTLFQKGNGTSVHATVKYPILNDRARHQPPDLSLLTFEAPKADGVREALGSGAPASRQTPNFITISWPRGKLTRKLSSATLPGPNWSRPLPQPLLIPDVMVIATLADVRELMRHLPADRRARVDLATQVANRR